MSSTWLWGVVIGAAFSSVVQAVVNDILNPIIQALGGQTKVADMAVTVGGITFPIGDLVNALITFVLIALVVYVLVVLLMDLMVCWLTEHSALRAGNTYAIKHTTRWARALVKRLHYRLDVNTLHRHPDAAQLALNEIGRIGLRTTAPLLYDEYRRNRTTGSIILVDEVTNNTVAAGMILGPSQ